MPYSGADVLTNLSELARQRAGLRPISAITVVARDVPTGNLIRSSLRAVVGYDADIRIFGTVPEAALQKAATAQIAFLAGDELSSADQCQLALQHFRNAGFVCPAVFIVENFTVQLGAQILRLGALDVFARDDICGLNLRKSLLKLASAHVSGTVTLRAKGCGR